MCDHPKVPETSETADLPDDLVAGWRAIVGQSEQSDATMFDLAGRYAEPHRRYHGLDHLIHVVRRAAALIDAIRNYGHLAASIDPLGAPPLGAAELSPA